MPRFTKTRRTASHVQAGALLPCACLAATALGVLAPCAGWAAVALPDGFADDVVVSGLVQPNSLAMLPDGRVLLTEQRTGWVRMVVSGHVAATDPVLMVPEVNSVGLERGLQGIAVDPSWPTRPFVYLMHNRVGNRLRVVRYAASGDLDDPSGESLSLDSPLVLLDDLPDAGQLHNGGCLRFGPLGLLFVSLGDDEEPCAATDSTSLRGQILRLRVSDLSPEGGGPVPRHLITPAGNPLASADSNAKLVWAYGLRNPWRFHVDPTNERLYVADPGDASFEEYNEVEPGDHLGWPYREGSLVISRILCPEPGGPGANPYQAPIASFPNQPGLSAVTGAGIYRAPVGGTNNWPAEYEGNLFFGDYYHGFLRRLVRQGDDWVPAAAVAGQPNPTDWATGLIAGVDFGVGPDGSLWWLSQFDSTFQDGTGALHRIRFVGPLTGADPRVRAGRRLEAAPNPFAGQVELTFAISEAADVTLDVYDLAGRRVRRLYEGWVAPVRGRVVWDGRDRRGAAVAPGVYLVRLEGAGEAQALRILRLE